MQTTRRQGASQVAEESVLEALADLGALFAADGASLHLVALEEPRASVTVAVQFDGVECMECVLPPEQLRSVVEEGFRRRIGTDCHVAVLDPRATTSLAEKPPMHVLDPRGVIDVRGADDGPGTGGVEGKRVGFRVDVLWPAWDVVVEEWSATLREAGAVATPTWRRMQGLTGEEGRAKQNEYVEFLRSLDVAIVGLGNCGGCTAYTVDDSLTALEAGLPTVAAVTAHFEPLGRSLCAHRGHPGLPMVVLPYPLHTLPEPEVRSAARSSAPSMLKMLGVAV